MMKKDVSYFTQFPIIRGAGWGEVRIDSLREDVETFLEVKGQISYEFPIDYHVDYPEFGMQVVYTNPEHKVKTIFFFNGDDDSDHLIPFPYHMVEKINWDSSKNHVRKILGRGVEYKGKKLFNNWVRMVYNGIDFRFIGNRMVRISVFKITPDSPRI